MIRARHIIAVAAVFAAIFFTVLLVQGCATKPPVSPTPSESPAPIATVQPLDLRSALKGIVEQNPKCSGYKWKDRAVAPVGYMNGMAMSFARSYCRAKKIPALSVAKAAGDPATDVLAHYGKQSAQGLPALLDAWTIALGLGMRESSGKYCEGRDMSATNTAADTAEAGLFQASANSLSAHPELENYAAEYAQNLPACELQLFVEGVNASHKSCQPKVVGDEGSKGRAFQQLSRECPAFAAEYAVTLTRSRRKHFGPLNRKEAEYRTECRSMFEQVAKLVDNNLAVVCP